MGRIETLQKAQDILNGISKFSLIKRYKINKRLEENKAVYGDNALYETALWIIWEYS